MNNDGSGGGAAAAAGLEFQYRASAWIAVRIVAEKAACAPWQLPVTTTLDWLRCETEQPVDDLMVGTSDGGHIFCQIKRSLDLSVNPNSDLASTIGQFVRQFLSYRNRTPGKRPWERPLDQLRDRLVLITGLQASGRIRSELPIVLSRIQALGRNQDMDDAASNKQEKRTLSVLLQHIREAWHSAVGSQPGDADLRDLLSLIRIHVLNADPDETAQREAKDLLCASVLIRPEDSV